MLTGDPQVGLRVCIHGGQDGSSRRSMRRRSCAGRDAGESSIWQTQRGGRDGGRLCLRYRQHGRDSGPMRQSTRWWRNTLHAGQRGGRGCNDPDEMWWIKTGVTWRRGCLVAFRAKEEVFRTFLDGGGSFFGSLWRFDSSSSGAAKHALMSDSQPHSNSRPNKGHHPPSSACCVPFDTMCRQKDTSKIF